MREVDRRSKHSRRTFLKSAAAAAPVAAIATSIPLSIEDTCAGCHRATADNNEGAGEGSTLAQQHGAEDRT